MKAHVQFLCGPEGTVEASGSDGIFVLDARNCKTVWRYDARERMQRMAKIHPEYTGFSLRKGDLKSNHEVYREVNGKQVRI